MSSIPIGLDIIHDFPWPPDLATYLTRQSFTMAQVDLVAICSARNYGSDIPGIGPPSNPSSHQVSGSMPFAVGFNNVPVDRAGVIRRQFLGMPSDPICLVSESFSLLISTIYLAQYHDIALEWVSTDSGTQQIQLGKQRFVSLPSRAGGYH